jgi:hypothetical protein
MEEDVSKLPAITDALVKTGYSDRGNMLRVMEAVEKAADRSGASK